MKIITERNEWNQVLLQFPNINDVFFNYDYFDLYKSHFDVETEAIFYEDPNILVFWSHLVREIPQTVDNVHKFYDLITPYGYGGPLVLYKCSDNLKILESLHYFMKEYLEFALKKNYVCEFIRFHPILKNWEPFFECFPKSVILEKISETVIIDLTKNIDQIWQELRKGHKYNINKTQRENCDLTILENPSESEIEAFIILYHKTMKNNGASTKYFFPPSFIKDHFTRLSTVLISINYCGQLIGSSMFIIGDSFVHYHLSGSNKSLKGLYPSELIIWAAIKWAKERKFQIFHLGGGLKNRDSLYFFKIGFSPDIASFYTGKLIFNSEQYNCLSNTKKNLNINKEFFPSYRTENNETII